MDYILGEGQFGPNRYRLSRAKQAYYQIRPFVPRGLLASVRRRVLHTPSRRGRLEWPIEDRYVRFMHQVLHVATLASSAAPGQAANGSAPRPQPLGHWPNGAQFAFVLTHDVERAEGQAFVRELADLDERYGFRSAFNFVAEDYPVDLSLLAELRARGFEVGVHGLKHDGKLFDSWAGFVRRAERINHYTRVFQAAGFRSPSMHRNPAWMQVLDIEYDSSSFDTDPFEPQPGGTMSIWPFFCGRFVELPYTLPQDHTLLVIFGERTPQVWVDKVDFIARWGGMALLNTHPDYQRLSTYRGVYEEFLQHMRDRMRQAAPAFWHALPRAVARWWLTRGDLAPAALRGA
jgi:hypothetical protein